MQLLASSRVIDNDHTLTEIECCFRQANLTCDCASMCDVVTFEHVIVLSFACTSRQKDPIQRKAFVDIHFIVCVFGASMCDVVTFVCLRI